MAPLPFDLQKDRRGKLLSEADVDRWYRVGNSDYEIGLKARGEFRMGAESGSILVRKNGSEDWMNFGGYRFFLPTFIPFGTPETWKYPFMTSPCGRWLVLHWLYHHVHGEIDVVIIDLRDRRYRFYMPKENLSPKSIRSHGNGCKIEVEYYYNQTAIAEENVKQVEIKGGFLPIDMFYKFDPYTANTDVCQWVDGKRHLIPLQEYLRKTDKNEFSESFENWWNDWVEENLNRVGNIIKLLISKVS